MQLFAKQLKADQTYLLEEVSPKIAELKVQVRIYQDRKGALKMNWHTKFPPESPPNFGRRERESKQKSKQLRIFCHFMSPAFLSAGTLASQTGIARPETGLCTRRTNDDRTTQATVQTTPANKQTQACARARAHAHTRALFCGALSLSLSGKRTP